MKDAAAPLEQARRLVETMTDEAFAFTTPLAPGGSPGRHLRHCLDFYDAFLGGQASGRVDYETRERDPEVERHRRRGLERIRRALRGIERLRGIDRDRPLLVRGEDEAEWIRSSVGRELQFLASHTIHHLALISILLRVQGEEPPAEVGVSPSTLRFRAAGG